MRKDMWMIVLDELNDRKTRGGRVRVGYEERNILREG